MIFLSSLISFLCAYKNVVASARLLDVDHRNLISLTGSPGQQGGAGGLKAAGDRNGKPTSPNWLNASGGGDTDFRSDPSAPPPIFGMQHTHPAPSIPPPRPGNFYGDDSGNVRKIIYSIL